MSRPPPPPLSANGQNFLQALLDFGFPQKMSNEVARASDSFHLGEYGPAYCLTRFMISIERDQNLVKRTVGADLYDSVTEFAAGRLKNFFFRSDDKH